MNAMVRTVMASGLMAGLGLAGLGASEAQPGPPTAAVPPPHAGAAGKVPRDGEFEEGDPAARAAWYALLNGPQGMKDLRVTVTSRGDGDFGASYRRVRWTRHFNRGLVPDSTRAEFFDEGDEPTEVWSLTRGGARFQLMSAAEKTVLTVDLREPDRPHVTEFREMPYWWDWPEGVEPAGMDRNFQFMPDATVRGEACRVVAFGAGPLPELTAYAREHAEREPPASHPSGLDFGPRNTTAWIGADGMARRVARTSRGPAYRPGREGTVSYDMEGYTIDAGLTDADLELRAPEGWTSRSATREEVGVLDLEPTRLPAFTLTDTAGATVTEKSLPVRTLLVFWTPWAKGTPAMFDDLKRLRAAVEPLGGSLTLVCVWAQDDGAAARAMKEAGWDGPSLLKGERLARRLKVECAPTVVEVRFEGKVVVHDGMDVEKIAAGMRTPTAR